MTEYLETFKDLIEEEMTKCRSNFQVNYNYIKGSLQEEKTDYHIFDPVSKG